jgi:hypothetical protein
MNRRSRYRTRLTTLAADLGTPRGGTGGRWLTADQRRDYAPWIDNDRRIRVPLDRLEALGTAAFEADSRWNR